MHMTDALISPIVGGVMWAAAGGVSTYSTKKLRVELEDKKIPLMGALGAFIFAAQMINFSIPGTGSSGHLGGGLLLAIILGPYAGFLTMTAILTIQALFFADGGLLSLGCNIINMGFYTCFIAYPFIYKPIVKKGYAKGRLGIATIFAAVVGLQLGAFSVVLETLFSGKAELPFTTFILFMQPIHLAIGIVEGIVVTAVVSFVWKVRPEIIDNAVKSEKNNSVKKLVIGFILVAAITGGLFSWFASTNPDGLEWSMVKTSKTEELTSNTKVHKVAEEIQKKTAFMPGYNLKSSNENQETNKTQPNSLLNKENAGTSAAGFIGGACTLALALLIGVALKIIKKRNLKTNPTLENK